MKANPLIFIFILLFLGAADLLQAQELGEQVMVAPNTVKEEVQENTVPLPAKQVVLLFEIDEIIEEELVDEPDNPEGEFAEAQLDNQIFDLNVLIHLFSTINIAKIHVKIGSQPGMADISAYSFTFDQKDSLPVPFTFVRDGRTIALGMGQVKGISSYYAEVVLESASGQQSEARYYSPQ